MATSNRNNSPNANTAPTTSDQPRPSTDLQRQFSELTASIGQPEALFCRATELLQHNHTLQTQIDKLKTLHGKMREEMDRLCAPEHYPAVVTEVERNGRVRVQAYIPGMASVRADVHPDVPLEHVQVGAQVYLSKQRNCLMEIASSSPAWHEVGTFEERLPDGRILVNYQQISRVLIVADALSHEQLHPGDRIGFHEGAAIAFAKLQRDRGEQWFSEAPVDDFAQLGGLESQIALLKRAVDFRFKNPDVAHRYRIPAKRGILLKGPPGNGKTRLARCVASYIRQLTGQECRFQSVVGSEDYSMWLGQSESKLKARFVAAQAAAESGPCVIFIDEIDALGRRRGTDHGGGAPDRILSTLLGLMDDVGKSLRNVVLIAATNRADALDPGLTRPGRLDLKIDVPNPNRQAASSILHRYLDGLPTDPPHRDDLIAPLLGRVYSPRGEYAEMVRVRVNDGRQFTVSARELISGATYEHLVRRAADEAASREIELKRPSAITADDLAICLERELTGATSILTPTNIKSYVPSIPFDAVPVEVSSQFRPRAHYTRPTTS